MPTYIVTAPDGQQYQITAPEGATQDEALQYAQQNYQEAGTGLKVKRVQYPDGSIHRIQVPEGATDDQIIAFAQQDQSEQPADGTRNNYQQPRQYTEDELFTKLEKADAAGDTEAARVIADEIRSTRGQQSNRTRLQKIEAALRAADAAGNADDARRLAQAYADERDNPRTESADMSAPSADFRDARPQAALPANFSNARGAVSSSASAATYPGRYNGPSLAPSASASAAPVPQTLETLNARNRAYRDSPQAASDRQRFEASQAAAKQEDFQSFPAPVRFAAGMGSRVAAAGRGAGQLYALAADQLAPGQQSRYGAAMGQEAQARKDNAYLQDDTAATLGGVAGDIGLLVAPGGAVNRMAGTAALAGNVGLGAGYAALQPVTQGESRGRNAGMGGAFGAAGYGVASGVRALGQRASQAIPSDIQQLARRANELGIPLHAGQVSQSLPVKVAASAGKYLPFSGYAGAAGRQQDGVNRAVAKTFGADAPKLTDDVMQRARQALSREFDAIYNRNKVPITESGARKLAAVEREASRRLTKDETQVLRNQLDDILENADGGVLTGQKYQAVRTMLRKAEGKDKLGMAVRELRQSLDDIAADAVGPSDAPALKALRSKWANFRTVEGALKQNAGAGGDIRLAALWPLIRKGSTKEMRELARMGQTLLKDPIADSGTAQRGLAYKLLLGGGSIANPALIPLIAKATLGGATLGRAANSNTLAKLLTRSNRGVPTSRLGELMQRATPYAAPTAAVRYNSGGGR